MTTPKTKAGQRLSGSAKAKVSQAKAHLSRPEPAASGPIRANKPGTADDAPPAGGLESDATVSASVAHAVKIGYDVIAENIKQGREAAQRFRHGEYNVREVPGDLEVVASRLLQLARELSTTTFDVCERLLKEVAAKGPSSDRAADLPPFRTPKARAEVALKTAAQTAAPADPAVMKITVRFVGGAKALAHTAVLSRPIRPTAVADISAQPLAPRNAGLAPIAGVSFETDVSVEGVIAVVTVPKGQAPGFYSGLVRAKTDNVPLGVLTIEIAE